MKTYFLTPQENQKSFYKKATVKETENFKTLVSYTTEVVKLCKNTNVLTITKNENHLSNTTLRHINSFLLLNSFSKLTKKEIIKL